MNNKPNLNNFEDLVPFRQGQFQRKSCETGWWELISHSPQQLALSEMLQLESFCIKIKIKLVKF